MFKRLKGNFIFCIVVVLSIVIFRLFIRDSVIEHLDYFGRDSIKSNLLFLVVFSFIEFILGLLQHYDIFMIYYLIMYIMSVSLFYTFKYKLFGIIPEYVRVFLLKNFGVLFDDAYKEE